MQETIHKVFKIRNKETGLFSKGGTNTYNLWSKEGKSWSNIGHLKNHLNQFLNRWCKENPYENAEIVEVEINYDTCMRVDVNELFNELKQNKERAEEAYRQRLQRWKEERERKQLEELKVKYESV
ncbi:hypothetical protein D3C73_184940 [compost metagenome]